MRKNNHGKKNLDNFVAHKVGKIYDKIYRSACNHINDHPWIWTSSETRWKVAGVIEKITTEIIKRGKDET
jgi:hypothetical protein